MMKALLCWETFYYLKWQIKFLSAFFCWLKKKKVQNLLAWKYSWDEVFSGLLPSSVKKLNHHFQSLKPIKNIKINK